MMNWLAFQFLMYGPHRVVCNADTRFGAWCLRGAGGWAYRDHKQLNTIDRPEGG